MLLSTAHSTSHIRHTVSVARKVFKILWTYWRSVEEGVAIRQENNFETRK
jgi:hypothetical protein